MPSVRTSATLISPIRPRKVDVVPRKVRYNIRITVSNATNESGTAMRDKTAEKERLHQHYLQHKDEVKQRAKKWTDLNRERHKEIARESARRIRQEKPPSEQSKKAAVERVKAWQKTNSEKTNAKNRAWRDANPERAKASREKWNLNNPTKRLERAQVRRARKLNAYIEPVNRTVVYKQANGICGICGFPVSYDKFHVDHIVPLSKGGMHCYANTQPAHARCNLKKSNKLN